MNKRQRKKKKKQNTVRYQNQLIWQDLHLLTHNPDNPDSWWFHPKEKDYFDWLNAGVDHNRLMVTHAFNMPTFHKMVSLPLSKMPTYINHHDPEIASLATYRLEKGIP